MGNCHDTHAKRYSSHSLIWQRSTHIHFRHEQHNIAVGNITKLITAEASIWYWAPGHIDLWKVNCRESRLLTNWFLGDSKNMKMTFSNTIFVANIKFIFGIIWANVAPYLCRCMPSLGHNELIWTICVLLIPNLLLFIWVWLAHSNRND